VGEAVRCVVDRSHALWNIHQLRGSYVLREVTTFDDAKFSGKVTILYEVTFVGEITRFDTANSCGGTSRECSHITQPRTRRE
jgi:hypothetical protein